MRTTGTTVDICINSMYREFQHLYKEMFHTLNPRCSTIKDSTFTSTCSSETVYLCDKPSQADCKVLKFTVHASTVLCSLLDCSAPNNNMIMSLCEQLQTLPNEVGESLPIICSPLDNCK